jgi:hypothetical protein
MGMDLQGAGGYYRWTASSWNDVLTVGEHYGWMPIGTGPPRGVLKAEWPGAYYSNDGARFYAKDAVALAIALEEALVKMPARQPAPLRSIIHYEYMVSKKGKEDLKRFIDYCRAGSFRLY